MKTIIFAFAIAVLSTTVQAQDIQQSQVPSLVLNAFQSKFTNATDIEWELKGDLYKAEFEIGKRDHDVWIDKNGNIKKHKEDFPKSQLPEAIRQKIASDYKAYTIDDVDKIEEEGKIQYKVELDSKAGDKEVIFSADGKVVG